MKLEQIEQILSLADTGSFTETARRLYISQPNLSASVKQLENEIGNIIFERTPSGLVVTPFGLEYLHHLRAVKRELDATEAFLGQAPHRIRLSLNIATTKCIWINDFFSGIINHYDGNQLNFSLYNTENSDAAMDLVHTSACDLAFVSLTGPEQKELVRRSRSMGLEYHKLYASPMHIMLGRKNPLYHQEGTFPLKELSNTPMSATEPHGSWPPPMHSSCWVFPPICTASSASIQTMPSTMWWKIPKPSPSLPILPANIPIGMSGLSPWMVFRFLLRLAG